VDELLDEPKSSPSSSSKPLSQLKDKEQPAKEEAEAKPLLPHHHKPTTTENLLALREGLIAEIE